MKRALFICTLAALLVGLSAGAQSADFTRYVALGDSLTAGFSSGGLVQTFQQGSYPALLAHQAGTPDFEQPLVSEPGIPVLLSLQALLPNPVIMAPDVAPGQPINAEYPAPYNNLGVPGATLYDLLYTTGDIMNLLAGNQDNVMHDLILRDGEHTALQQAIGLQPTFVTMWIGNNDILGAAVYGTPVEGVTMTPVADFQQMYQTALGALATNTSADIVVITLPDVAAIPFVTTVKPYITLPDGSHVPLIGSNGPLPEDAYVTLNAAGLLAQGYGLPPGIPGANGMPLPEDIQIVGGVPIPGVVLRPDEVAIIRDRTAAFNNIIRDTAAALGAKVFDINDLFSSIVQGDFGVLGGITLNADFLTGGIFSYDGVHPQAIGYGLVAMSLIDFINQSYGTSIPQVNMFQILCPGGDCAGPADSQAVHAVFSQQAAQQLQQVFAPRLPPAPTARRATGSHRAVRSNHLLKVQKGAHRVQ
jgi:lysophospholipase L1-like esterase